MLFYHWTKLDRSDLATISFESLAEFSRKLEEKNLDIHDRTFFEMEVGLKTHTSFYAFPSKIKHKFALEWYTNMNFARSAQRELVDHKRRTRRF